MDEEIPLSQCPLSFPNTPNSLPSTSSSVHLPFEYSQFSLEVLSWLGLLSGSTNIDCDNYTQKLSSSPSDQSFKAKNTSGSKLGDNKNNNNGGENKAKVGRKKKAIPQRISFHTRSDDDVLDDGYRWRKYGQKTVKNSSHPRSYYRCSHHTCSVKKQIQRLSKDSSIVVTTYEGIHNHPCEKLMETLGPLLKQLQFLSRI
ncbi:WRKY domain containing protein [Trema orientale]|uniref:WRKY domain containing protein n=1 Tax=Trema orientale TaxID=63057 RepID=A0A2P5FJ19_TREOI|nr:WRKY domain containing protein [Trema orientale]